MASNPEKPVAFLSQDDRLRLASLATQHLGNVRCVAFQGVTGAVANEHNADVIIRSAHKEADLERSLAVLNKFMSGGIPTEFAPIRPGRPKPSRRRRCAAPDRRRHRRSRPRSSRRQSARSCRHPPGRSAGRPADVCRPGADDLGRRVQAAADSRRTGRHRCSWTGMRPSTRR